MMIAETEVRISVLRNKMNNARGTIAKPFVVMGPRSHETAVLDGDKIHWAVTDFPVTYGETDAAYIYDTLVMEGKDPQVIDVMRFYELRIQTYEEILEA